MNIRHILVAATVIGATLTSCQKHIERANLKNAKDTLSYAIGYTKGVSMANSIKREIPDGDSAVNKTIMLAGIINGLNGDKINSQMTEEQAREVIQEYFKDLENKRILAENDAYQKKKDSNNKIMEEYAKEEGMKALPKPDKYDGPAVLVKEISAGKGDTIGIEDYVYMSITQKLVDGRITFQTPEGEYRMMPMKGLVKGLQQGLRTLKPGAVANIVVPSELGFGRQGKNEVPANSILLFEVGIQKVFHNEKEARAFWKQEQEKRGLNKAAEAAANAEVGNTKPQPKPAAPVKPEANAVPAVPAN